MIDNKAYQNYFLRIVYVGFMEYILNGIGIIKFNNILKQEHMFDARKGVNPKISKLFRKFLEGNKAMLETVSKNRFKVFTPKNICGGPLASPINCDDDELMVQQGIRPPVLVIDKTVFMHSAQDREKVKSLKRIVKLSSDKGMFRDVYRKPNGCFIVHIKNQTGIINFKTTHRYKCAEHEVRTILATFHEGEIITGMKFNGRNI